MELKFSRHCRKILKVYELFSLTHHFYC